MRNLSRREKQQYVFGGVIAVFGLISLLFFIGFYLPIRAEYLFLLKSIEQYRVEATVRTQELEKLEVLNRQIEAARIDRLRFLTTRFVSRQTGFSQMIPDLHEMAKLAGIERNRVQYIVENEPQFGLSSVKINIPVRGDYAAVRRFIRALESSGTFYILDSIGLTRSNSEVVGALDLSMSLTTFFSYEG